jgi:hypothetical protein
MSLIDTVKKRTAGEKDGGLMKGQIYLIFDDSALWDSIPKHCCTVPFSILICKRLAVF